MSEWGKLTKWGSYYLFGVAGATRKINAGVIRVGAGKARAPSPDKYQWIVDLHPWPEECDESPEPQRIARGYCATLEAAKRCAETIANDAERMIELMGSTNTTAKD
jgi:hypothetical protein